MVVGEGCGRSRWQNGRPDGCLGDHLGGAYVHRGRSLAALAAIMVLRSERYCPLVSIPRNQPRYREHRHHPRQPGMRMVQRSSLALWVVHASLDIPGITELPIVKLYPLTPLFAQAPFPPPLHPFSLSLDESYYFLNNYKRVNSKLKIQYTMIWSLYHIQHKRER